LFALRRWVEEDGLSVDSKDPTSFGHKPHSASPRLDSLGGKTPLYHAVSNDQAKAVEYLLAKGAHVDPKYSGGRLVLPGEDNPNSSKRPSLQERTWSDVAAEAASYTEINDGSLPSKLHTPLHVAASRGNAAVVRLLVEATADVGGEDGDCNTPLHLAASAEVVLLLLWAGAGRCMTRLNKWQRTPDREMAARSWSWPAVKSPREREAPMKEFVAWPRLVGAHQRLAWCRAVLRHDFCCGVVNECNSALHAPHELHGSVVGTIAASGEVQGQDQRRLAQVFLSLDLAEMVVEMLAPATGCAKELATRSGRIGRAASNNVLCKDAQERIEKLWAARGSKLSAQVEAELFAAAKRQRDRKINNDKDHGVEDVDVVAKCVLCHIKTSRWCAGCAGVPGTHTNLISGLRLPTTGKTSTF
jgi:hypothetical protein